MSAKHEKTTHKLNAMNIVANQKHIFEILKKDLYKMWFELEV